MTILLFKKKQLTLTNNKNKLIKIISMTKKPKKKYFSKQSKRKKQVSINQIKLLKK